MKVLVTAWLFSFDIFPAMQEITYSAKVSVSVEIFLKDCKHSSYIKLVYSAWRN